MKDKNNRPESDTKSLLVAIVIVILMVIVAFVFKTGQFEESGHEEDKVVKVGELEGVDIVNPNGGSFPDSPPDFPEPTFAPPGV